MREKSGRAERRSTANPGNAEPQLGSSVGNKEEKEYRRKLLPHVDTPGLLQSISYRLADSVPSTVLQALERELESEKTERRDSLMRRRIEEFLDSGHGSCILRNPEAASVVIDTWRRFDQERYDLIAWVVMPNHVHILIRVYPNQSLARIVQSWKSYTGRKIRPLLEKSAMGSEKSHRVWMRDYWDRFIRDEEHLKATVDYIHLNPVKARLVVRPEDWKWSSAGPR